MGVPYYFYNLYKKYNKNYSLVINDLTQTLNSIDIDYLFLDYNSLIHPCARNVMDRFESNEIEAEQEQTIESHIIRECIIYTQSILTKIKPKTLYIMIDGVAPRGKVNQQRERRYKSYYMRETNKSMLWDTNKITPGTQFMSDLSSALLDNFTDECIFISDAGEHGEGEHKMMKVIDSLPTNKNICIYGLDADLIMLSMLSTKADNIILLRHNADGPYTFLRVSMLRIAVYAEIMQLLQENQNINKDFVIADYVFLCFLVGNDFLPSLPNLNLKHNAMEVIVKSYCKSISSRKCYLTTKSGINLDILGDIISDIAQLEQYYFNKIFYKNQKNNILKLQESIETKHENVSILYEDCIKYNKPGFKKRHYMFYGIQENCKSNLFLNYIEGLHWVWGYYNLHSHDNWTWFYKFHSAPFASDLTQFMKTSMTEIKEYLLNNSNFIKSIPLSPIQQLMIVLPECSLINVLRETNFELSKKLERLLKTQSSITIDNMYPKTITLDMMNKDQLWQSKVLFQSSDFDFVKLINAFLLNA